ncbi:hypothetical protein GCT19_37145 [Paraburkholderia sp. CNPSo 3155]|nr:hypothetical protein [Paraburkholderia atlantica]NUY35943.1 hypothetical protein [Paraburkholderia atlantica]
MKQLTGAMAVDQSAGFGAQRSPTRREPEHVVYEGLQSLRSLCQIQPHLRCLSQRSLNVRVCNDQARRNLGAIPSDNWTVRGSMRASIANPR